MAVHLRAAIERDRDTLAHLHLWRLGHPRGSCRSARAIRAILHATARLAGFWTLSHLTIEVRPRESGVRVALRR